MKTHPISEGFSTITPYFTVRGVPAFIAFLKQAFEAVEVRRSAAPNGAVMNAELRIGDSMIMMGEAPQNSTDLKTMTSMLYMYVTDADSVYERAMKAGGKSVREPVDQIYGERVGAIEDPFGNQWWIATRLENVSAEELSLRLAQHKKR